MSGINSNIIFHISPSSSNEVKAVGHQRTFWTCDFSIPSFYELNATLLAIGEHCCIYMQDDCISELGESVAISQTETIRDEYDTSIYPQVIDLAGHPNGTLGDIDNDPRIFILLSRNTMTYYSERNEFSSSIVSYTNECEMFYLYYKCHSISWTLAVVAHEFHHLIWFNNELDEPPLTLEALAQYAMYHAGYLAPYNNLAPQVGYYLSHPEDSILYWSHNDYGSGYLLAFYIAEHYGVEILRNLITEPSDGPAGIETVLQRAGHNITFNELYVNWITALTIDEPGFQNDIYGFKEIDAKITRFILVNDFPILNDSVTLQYYGFHIHKLLSPPDNFTVQIKKFSNHAIATSIASHDAFGWHIRQNIHDEKDTIITDNIVGNSIDVAYVLTSYVSKVTPVASRNETGPSTGIEISIFQSQGIPKTTPQVPTTVTKTSIHTSQTSRSVDRSNWDQMIPLSIFLGICLLFGIIITIWLKAFSRRK